MDIKKKGTFKVLITTFVALSLIMNAYLFLTISNLDTSTAAPNNNNPAVQNVRHDVTSDIVDTVKQVSDSVVGIAVYGNNQMSGSGSGVIYKVEGNTVYIITNHHVISDASSIAIVFENEASVEATLVGSDQFNDIAVLKATVDFEASPIKIGDSDLLKKGETVLAIGSPLGIHNAGTVTQGIVSAVDRTVSVNLSDSGQDWDMNVIQTDAAINPGNSGGAFVNAVGELVGITSMKISDASVEGMGFALPINSVMKDVEEIEKTGKVNRPVMGIRGMSISGLSSHELRYYNIETNIEDGIYVSSVESNSAAARAGIQDGDIITKFGDVEITTYKSFLAELYSKKAGDVVQLEVNRNGKQISLEITLGAQ